MLKLCVVVYLIVFGIVECFSSSGYSVLKLFNGVKATSLGENFCGVYGDVETVYYNPAGLIDSNPFELRVAYLSWVADINKSDIIISKLLKNNIAAAVALNYLWTELENISGNFSFNSYVLNLAFAKKVKDNFYAGISAKLAKEDVSFDSSSNLSSSIDFGVIFRKQRFTLGGSVQNLGTTISSSSSAQDVPPTLLNCSVSYITFSNSIYLFNLKYNIVDNVSSLSIGYEFGFKKTIKEQFVFRLGYVWNLNYSASVDTELLNFRFGIGFRKEGLMLDYTLIPISFDLGFYHYIGLGFAFY